MIFYVQKRVKIKFSSIIAFKTPQNGHQNPRWSPKEDTIGNPKWTKLCP